MHPDIIQSVTPVWAPWRFNLGDHWQTVNYLITRSFVLREEQLLSRYQHGKDYGERLHEILSLINAPERSKVTIVDEPGTHEPDGFDVWAAPSWPAKQQWLPSFAERSVTYQFDGISSAESKNPPADDVLVLLREIELHCHSSVALGKDLTLAGCVHALMRSSLFVGCDSGMSHLAHAVGTPMIIIEYGLPVITCHRGKHFELARGTLEASYAISRILGRGLHAGL